MPRTCFLKALTKPLIFNNIFSDKKTHTFSLTTVTKVTTVIMVRIHI